MHDSKNELPPAEKSLKYMAWDLKEIGKSLKELNAVLLEIKKTMESRIL